MAAATLASAERSAVSSWSTICWVAEPDFSSARAAPQILLRPVARRLGVAQIGLGLLDLGRLGGREQIGELAARLLQEPARLIDRRPVVGLVLLEQRLALGDPVAARDMDGGQKARLGRSDLDEVGFRVALPGDRVRSWGLEQRPGGWRARSPRAPPGPGFDETRAMLAMGSGPAPFSAGVRPDSHTLSGIST